MSIVKRTTIAEMNRQRCGDFSETDERKESLEDLTSVLSKVVQEKSKQNNNNFTQGKGEMKMANENLFEGLDEALDNAFAGFAAKKGTQEEQIKTFYENQRDLIESYRAELGREETDLEAVFNTFFDKDVILDVYNKITKGDFSDGILSEKFD